MPGDVKLLPCPFCGHRGKTWLNDSIHGSRRLTVVCAANLPDAGCGSCAGYYDSEPEAIAAWNRRTPAASSEGGAGVVVPREPTVEMLSAGMDKINRRLCEASDHEPLEALWTAMLDAAPATPAAARPVAGDDAGEVFERCARVIDGLAERAKVLHAATPDNVKAAWGWDKQREALLWAAGDIRALAAPSSAPVQGEVHKALLARWLKTAESGIWRDFSHLSLAAHPLTDDTRAALTPPSEAATTGGEGK